jgi:hypothetical protein
MWPFTIKSFVTCRSYEHSRTQVGEPNKDIYTFCAYSFPWHGENEYELRWEGDPKMFITHNRKLMRLGYQYELTISDKPPGAQAYAYVNNLPIESYDFNYTLRGFGPSKHADYWIGKLKIRSKKQVLFNIFGEQRSEVPYYVNICN